MASVLDAVKPPAAPYPGLRPFEASEWRIFFGRETMTREVIDLVYKHRFVMVHGASGSGKSSLIRAGVLPSIELEQRLSGGEWRSGALKPSEGPLTRLAQILETNFPAADCLPGGGAWADEIHRGVGLLETIEAAIARQGGGRFYLLIDQFEELFRLSGWAAPAETSLFIEILNRAAEPDNGAPSLSVILTMRSDYLGHCARYAGFAETVNRCQYLLPKMDDFGLLLAIRKPAEMFHGKVAEAASDALLRSTVGEVDRLPILQHALMRAWRNEPDRPEGWELALADFDNIGGVGGALGRHADDVLNDALECGEPEDRPARAEALEWMFRSLTDLDADGLGVRRTRRFSELVGVAGAAVDKDTVRAMIDRFRAADCSFLAPYGSEPLTDDAAVEISHEALIRKWGRLGDRRWENGRPIGWVWREFQDGQTWRALAVLAQGGGAVLSPAATEQRLPWFNTILRRPSWIRRYSTATAAAGGQAEQADGKSVELTEVEGLFLRSKRSLARHRRRPIWISGAAIVSVAAVAIAVLAYERLQADQEKAQLQSKADASATNATRATSMLKQSQAGQATYAVEIGKSVINATCKAQYKDDPEGQQDCQNNLLKLYPNYAAQVEYPQIGAGGVVASGGVIAAETTSVSQARMHNSR